MFAVYDNSWGGKGRLTGDMGSNPVSYHAFDSVFCLLLLIITAGHDTIKKYFCFRLTEE